MPFSHTILAIVISMLWGANFVVSKVALLHFPVFLLLALRLALVSALLAPFMRKPQLPLADIFKASFILTVVHFGLMFSGLALGVDASIAVVIDQLRVPFAVTLGYFLFGERIEKKGAFGILLAIIGTFIITGAPTVTGNHYALWMMVGAAAVWAFYNIQVKNLKNVKMLPFIGWLSLFGAAQNFILSFIFESGQVDIIKNITPVAFWSLVYIAVAATIIGHGCWYFLLQKHPVSLVVPYSLLIPVFGMLAGILLLGEKVTWHIIIGGALTVAGVAVIMLRKPWVARKF